MQAGKPRPNYLTVCNPDTSIFSATTPIAEQFIRPSDCDSDEDIDDFLRSFPSGHASSATVLAIFGMLYLNWTLYFRNGHRAAAEQLPGGSRHLLWDLGHGFMTAWNVGMFSFVRPSSLWTLVCVSPVHTAGRTVRSSHHDRPERRFMTARNVGS